DRLAEHRLARTRFADQAERLAAGEGQRHPVDGAQLAAPGAEAGVDVLDHQHRALALPRGVHSGSCLGFRTAHSFTSRAPPVACCAFSPTMLNENTVRNRKTPGTSTMNGCFSNWPPSPSAIMLPQVGSGGLMPSPRKLSEASATMSTDTMTMPSESSGSATFGAISRIITRHRVAPMARAASTNSRWENTSVLARAMRIIDGIASSASANETLRRLVSSTEARAISRISAGTASRVLVKMPITASTRPRK